MSADHAAEAPTTPGDTSGPGDDPEVLLHLAITRPAVAAQRASDLLGARPSPLEASIAHQTLAIVQRDRGRLPQALASSRAALRAGPRPGPGREAQVRATLATTLLFAGRTGAALRELGRARELSPPEALPRVLHLTGATYWLLGRYHEALETVTRSIALSREVGDGLWEGRAHGLRGDVLRALGDAAGSEEAYRLAEEVLTALGEDVEALLAARNRALVAAQQGDVVSALRLLEQASDRYRHQGMDPFEQTLDHVAALMSVRLVAEARALVDVTLERPGLPAAWRAELLVASSRAALLERGWSRAEEDARAAEALFRAHRRSRWAAHAALLAVEAGYAGLRDGRHAVVPSPARDPSPQPPGSVATGPGMVAPSARELLRRARPVVARLRRLEDPSLPEALLLLAQLARDAGDRSASRLALEESARSRHVGTPLARAAGWLAAALLADLEGPRRALFHACRRGLDAVDEHRTVIGDLELRALASGYGVELAGIALAEAVRSGGPRGMVRWAERWRASALESAPLRPADPTLDEDVAALRDLTRRLDGGDEPPATAVALHRERDRLEVAVRRRYRRLRGERRTRAELDLDALVASLGDTLLLCLVVVGDDLHVVAARHGRMTRRRVGPVAAATAEAAYAAFSLRRVAHGRRVDLPGVARRLQAAVLGHPPCGGAGADRVVVVPPAGLLSLPWSLLPALSASSVTVAPSLTMWDRARRAPAPPGATVALVTGPGLTTDQEETTRLGDVHLDARVLGGADASVEAALAAMDGAALAHVAAHGSYRADAPQFSSLTLADGPLTVHDLDRLERAPAAMVLSACDTAGLAPIAADEALGLVASLLAMGTRSVVASVAPVNDRATVVVMDRVHRVVAAGGSLADGLRAARTDPDVGEVVRATAAAFTAFGA